MSLTTVDLAKLMSDCAFKLLTQSRLHLMKNILLWWQSFVTARLLAMVQAAADSKTQSSMVIATPFRVE
jgi:hypothetical protein